MSVVASLKRRQSASSDSAVRGLPIIPSDPTARVRSSSPAPPAFTIPPFKETPLPAVSHPARMPTPAPTPTKRQPVSSAKKQLPVRSTRSSGKADHFQPLEGAPETKKPVSHAKAPPRRQKAIIHKHGDDDSEEEIVMTRGRAAANRTPTKAPPVRRTSVKKGSASRLPSPSPEAEEAIAESTAEDADGQETAAIEVDERAAPSPPSRKRAQRVAQLPLPPSPALSTPSKKRAASVVSSTIKTVTPIKKRARREAIATDIEEDVFGPVPSTSSSSTPRKDASTTPATTPSRPSSKTVTPSRSSSRIQRLPPSALEIANAPASLRSRLVGFHMEDEGYGVEPMQEKAQSEERESEDDEVEEDEEEGARRRAAKGKGKARMMDEDEQAEDVEMATVGQEAVDDFAFSLDPPRAHRASTPATQLLPAANPSYLSSPLGTHLASTLALLSGARLPRPFLASNAKSTLPPRSARMLDLPYLEGGYDEWERPLRSALDECVTKGMGNAVMLLGPRGVGKTIIVERTLALLSHAHGADAFVTVRLSGLVHTTDRLALRSIAVQLQEQGFGTADLVADEGDYSSNSATMSTLLRLLEPSTASTAPSATSAGASSSSGVAKGKSKPLLLIVDEFDLFAAHPRQSFLYCLLDIVQGNRRSGGFAVVGISARVDCLSLLEKRVRSRCQSHVLQMIPRSSFTAFGELAARLLRADERAWELVRGREGKEWASDWNREVERFLAEKKVVEYLNRLWSIHGNVPTELRSALSHLCYRLDYQSRVHGLDQGSTIPRLSFDMLKPQPRGEDKARDHVLKHLSIPQLTALIAAKHLSTATLDRQAGFNFEMVYDGYLAHVRRVSASTAAGGTMRALSKPALREAFDALRSRELVLPRASSGAGGGALTAGTGLPVSVPSAAYRAPTQRDPWKMYRLTTWARDVDREVEARGAECPLALRRWCKNWLD
ncbi:hypothetical protein JCM3770_005896 [Rhodotorula araucariae]